MKTCVALAVLFVAVSAWQVPKDYKGPVPKSSLDFLPDWMKRLSEKNKQTQRAKEFRQKRDITLEHPVGKNGKVFGALGENDMGLFGKAGYSHQVFNDGRGKLDAQVYGSRVLGPYGDSSHVGGGLNWKTDHASSYLDVSKQIHGTASVNAEAGARWPLGKNGDVSVGGYYSQTHGMGRDYGGIAKLNYRF